MRPLLFAALAAAISVGAALGAPPRTAHPVAPQGVAVKPRPAMPAPDPLLGVRGTILGMRRQRLIARSAALKPLSQTGDRSGTVAAVTGPARTP